MNIQNYRLDNYSGNNIVKSTRPTRRSQEKQERQAKLAQMGQINIPAEKKYLRKESLTDCLIVLSSAVKEENTGKIFDAIGVLLKRIQSPNYSEDPDQINYIKNRIVDALVGVYRNEISRQYEIIKNNEMYLSKVPNNFIEDVYKYDPEAKKRASTRAILEDKYRTSIYGGYMTRVIERIIKEYEENQHKNSPIKRNPSIIQSKIPVDKEAYIAKMKKEIKSRYDYDDR